MTLPLILPGIVAGAILAFAKAMGEFGATITFVSNIPGQTQTLPSAIYAFLQVPGGEAQAARLVAWRSRWPWRRSCCRNGWRGRWRGGFRGRDAGGQPAPCLCGLPAGGGVRGRAGRDGLFGRSGAGKTTIAQGVAGLLRPDAGRIVLGGEVLLDTARGICLPPHRRRLGYVFQDARLFPHMSVRQNLDYGRRLSASPPDAAEAARIIDLLGIGALLDRRPGGLSGGERQRVALGRAILSGPRGLLMDEPLAALDEARKAEILPYIERLRDGFGLPILYVSHSVAEVARLADTVVLMEAGRVTAAGPAADLLADPGHAGAFGLRELGAVVTARVAAQEDDGLTRLDLGGTPSGCRGSSPRRARSCGCASWRRT